MRAGIYDKYNTREGEREMELGYIFTTYFKTKTNSVVHFTFYILIPKRQTLFY